MHEARAGATPRTASWPAASPRRGARRRPRPSSTAASRPGCGSTACGTCATRAAADDLVQEVLVLTLERLRAGKVRDPDRLASFVLGTCRLIVRNLRRGHAAARGAARPVRLGVPSAGRSRNGRARPRAPPRLPGPACRKRENRPRADVLRGRARRRDRGSARDEPRERAHGATPGLRTPAGLRHRGRRVSACARPSPTPTCSTGGLAISRAEKGAASKSTCCRVEAARPARRGCGRWPRGSPRSCARAPAPGRAPGGRREASAGGPDDPGIPRAPGRGRKVHGRTRGRRGAGPARRRPARRLPARPRRAPRRWPGRAARGRALRRRRGRGAPLAARRRAARSSGSRRPAPAPAIDAGGERLLGEYTFDHRPWPGW